MIFLITEVTLNVSTTVFRKIFKFCPAQRYKSILYSFPRTIATIINLKIIKNVRFKTLQELSTATQYGIPVVVICLNNHFLGMVKQWQDLIYSGRHSQTYMNSLPDFVKLAESYGHVGIQISTPDELESKLQEAFSIKNKLVFVDINVDETEHVYPMQVRGGAMNEMILSKPQEENE